MGKPVSLKVIGGRLIGPATLTFPYRAKLAKGLRANESVQLAYYDKKLRQWRVVPGKVNPRRHTVTAKIKHFSFWNPFSWDWDGLALRLDQRVGELRGGRTGPAKCTSGVAVPSWADVSVNNGADLPIRTCAEGKNGQVVVQIVNNRPYSVMLKYGAPVSFGWHQTPSDAAGAAGSAMGDALAGPNELFLPPLSSASVGVPKGSWFFGLFQTKLNWHSLAADTVSLIVDQADGKVIRPALVGKLASECSAVLKPGVDGPEIKTNAVDAIESIAGCIEKALPSLAKASSLDAVTLSKLEHAARVLNKAALFGKLAGTLADLYTGSRADLQANGTFTVRRRSEIGGGGPGGGGGGPGGGGGEHGPGRLVVLGGDANARAGEGLTDVSAVAAGSQSSYALRSDGTVWGWGDNGQGQLGGATCTLVICPPTQIPGLSDVVAIAASRVNAYALRSDGTVWGWGGGLPFSCAYVTEGSCPTALPVRLSGLSDVTAIAAGEWNGYALRSDGAVWAWGSNGRGELGDGSPIECGWVECVSPTPVQVETSGVTAIAAGWNSAYALRSGTGMVEGWGDASFNQNSGCEQRNALGCWVDSPVTTKIGPYSWSGFLHGVTAIAASASNGYAVRSDGSVWAWGINHSGQLGNGTVDKRPCDVETGQGCGTDLAGPVSGLTSVSAVAGTRDAGGYAGTAGYALRTDGTVWAWGDNHDDQLGHALICDRDSDTGCESHVPVEVPNLTGATAIAGSTFGAYAIVSN